MSIDMEKAVEKDMSAINTDGTYEYVDNEDIVIQDEAEESIEEQTEKTGNENVVSMNEL